MFEIIQITVYNTLIKSQTEPARKQKIVYGMLTFMEILIYDKSSFSDELTGTRKESGSP